MSRADNEFMNASAAGGTVHDVAARARDYTAIHAVAPAYRDPTWKRLFGVATLNAVHVWLFVSYLFFVMGFETSPLTQVLYIFGPIGRLCAFGGIIAVGTKVFVFALNTWTRVSGLLEGGEPRAAGENASPVVAQRPGLGYHATTKAQSKPHEAAATSALRASPLSRRLMESAGWWRCDCVSGGFCDERAGLAPGVHSIRDKHCTNCGADRSDRRIVRGDAALAVLEGKGKTKHGRGSRSHVAQSHTGVKGYGWHEVADRVPRDYVMYDVDVYDRGGHFIKHFDRIDDPSTFFDDQFFDNPGANSAFILHFADGDEYYLDHDPDVDQGWVISG